MKDFFPRKNICPWPLTIQKISSEELPADKFHRPTNSEKFICSYASEIIASCIELQYMRLQD